MGQNEEFMMNYSSLMSKVSSEEFLLVINFCTCFRSNDLELYKEFKSKYNPNLNTDLIIDILSKRYCLDPVKDIRKIRDIYVNNVYNKGYVYHLTSTSNMSSIIENGLNPSVATKEKRDLNYAMSMLTDYGRQKFFLFKNTDTNKGLFYTRDIMKKTRYGKSPEWVRELNTAFQFFDEYSENESQKAKETLIELREEYTKKYESGDRTLICFSNSYTGKKSNFNSSELDKMGDPKAVIGMFESYIMEAIDENTKSEIPSNELIYIDYNTGLLLDESMLKTNQARTF